MEYLIRTYTNPGDTVLDNCMGSGTTLVAAKNLGRKAIGIEICREYCDIAIRRLEQEVPPLSEGNQLQERESSAQLPMFGSVAADAKCEEIR